MAAKWFAIAFVVAATSFPMASAQADCAQGEDDGGGHFISASISWRHLRGNTVRFEIASTWRRSFSWSSSAMAEPGSNICSAPAAAAYVVQY
eukprot:954927-Rhodomonas_salina.8